MKTPEPLIVTDLFPEVLDSLVDLLSGLPADDWDKPRCRAPMVGEGHRDSSAGGRLSILPQRDGWPEAQSRSGMSL
jgi:hypothetical protein